MLERETRIRLKKQMQMTSQKSGMFLTSRLLERQVQHSVGKCWLVSNKYSM